MKSIINSLIALLLCFILIAVLVTILDENPLHVFEVLYKGAFGSLTNIGYTLYYATPLLLTGLSVSWSLRAGLFNIGAEGQMAVGAMGACLFAFLLPEFMFPFNVLGAFLSAALAGGIWGSIAGYLKVKRNTHEVLSTILLNFIAYGLLSFFVLHLFKNTSSQAPETISLHKSYYLPLLELGSSPLSSFIFFPLILCVIYQLIMSKTTYGFRQKLMGSNPRLAVTMGYSGKYYYTLSLFISGALAGMASLNEVLGYAHKLREGFMGGAGFIGIAVALLGRNNGFGIIMASLLFGALHKGAIDLDIDTDNISRDIAMVIQALVILFVASERGLEKGVSRLWKK